ncbi:DNA invertase Pin-like site-specific DNA recombinase [Sporomusaceae bacterium BoRhaA]|uniref:recombinase family protein n=1 Tax=Pelorhabdus rhamnosifermentans TaxID=2772457 RepID=UPI001C05F5BA|nr:recombinase family protein [Pelorhabdus rhamnosifermentans]MBU2701536.1 DNA invertase Pin-like site-specific DNA recombinase [Pelorhabdus rhamnosifermentans]
MNNRRNNDKDLGPACFYLRKSREDQEAEARGEGETLSKHRKALFKLAKEYGVAITKVFEEVVSGENVIHRPVVIELLKEVEEGKWNSVWCMDIDRLGRGKMQDQGLIIDTFKNSHTKIVTPRKIYDLDDDLDEEYTEFEAFMARKELKIITRRLQGGRLRSIEDGNYLGTLPPYGYLIEKKDRKRYLIKNPKQAKPTALIWRLYRHEDMGTSKIANELNRLGYLSYTGKIWTAPSVLVILKNPVYAGIVAWKKKEQKKSIVPGKKRDTRSRPRNEQIWVYDAHEPYVTIEEFNKVQDMLAKRYHPPYRLLNGITNPLAGLIKCDLCGSSMIYRPYVHQQYPHLMCYNRHCTNKSCRFEYVEREVIEGLTTWLDEYQTQWENFRLPERQDNRINRKNKAYHNLQKELVGLEQQKNKLYDLLEKGIYDEKIYRDRSKKLSERISKAETAILETRQLLAKELQHEKARKDIVPKLEHVLDVYKETADAAIKNKLLKSVLEQATYRKEAHQKNDDFTLVLYPRLPKLLLDR